MNRRGRLFLAAYGLSGFAGLVYEVSWTRLLTLFMGHTTSAASTVVAAFMGGLAGGAAIGGRVARRLSPRQCLWFYAALELLVAVVALTLPLELHALTPALRSAYADGSGGVAFAAVRLAVCLVLLMIPALALGATFPAAVRWLVERSSELGARAGALYATNTTGAALGAVAAGFVLLPSLGLRATVLIGAVASALAILCVVAIARATSAAVESTVDPSRERTRAPAATVRTHADRTRPDRKRSRASTVSAPGTPASMSIPRWPLAAAVIGLTGFATLTYEIAWMRVFALTSGPSTYAFAGTVAAIIIGLAIGSTIGSALVARATRPDLALAVVIAITALDAQLASAYAGSGLPRTIATHLASAPAADGIEWLRASLLAKLVAPLAIGLGAAFPLTLQIGGASSSDGGGGASRMGALYAVNTVCSVAASLATGFLLIPWFGLQRTLACASGALVVAVALLAAFGPRTRGSLTVAVMAVALVFAVAMERPWDRDLLASGAYKYAPLVAKNLDVETALKAGTLLYYRDGASATVSVRRLTGELSLSVDGKVDASSTVDMLTQKALAHLPLLLHRDPHDVAVIGLGSGVTLGSALKHPVSSVDVVEIAPEVVDASRFFDAENGRALADPRARLIIGDGRSHLQLGARSYDVIISEPSNPWMAGIAALFTREFLAAARSRLRPGGVMCQWAHTYNMSDRDMRSIVATFASVFPNGTLWLIGDGDLLMVGSASPDPLPLANLPGAWTRPGVADDLAAVGASEPFALLSLYVGGAGEMRRYAADARVQTDDRMALEFSAPAALYRSEGDALVAVLRALLDPSQAPPPVAQAWASADGGMRRRRGDMLLKANAYAAAYGDYIAALDHNPEDLAAARGFVRAAVAARMTSSALAYLDRLGSAHHGSAALTIARSKLLAATGDYTHAVDAVRNVAADGRTDVDVAGQLASLYADLGDTEGLRTAVGHLRQVAPDGRDAHYYTAALQFMQADLAGAVESARRTVAIDPQYAPARNLLGAILATMGRTTEARSEFQSALALDPRDPAIYTNLGRLEFSLGDRHTAAGLYAEALSLDPTWEAARQGLSQAAGP